jgi:sulfite reductase beta subunit-like hemoprotein
MVSVRPATPSNDRCPGVLRLHEAADGWLARVRLPGGRADPRGLRALAAVARLGNGIVELTSRASVQLRGLPADGSSRCWEILSGAGLLPSVSHERVRNILASPVAGRLPGSVAATDDLVSELDRRLCAEASLAELSGRFLFAVDDGSGTIGPHRADITLRARRDGFFTLLPGGARVAADGAAGAAVEAAAARGERPPVMGAREPVLELIGCVAQRDGLVAVTALAPLGRLDGTILDALAGVVERHRTEVRISARRTVTVIDVPAADADRVLAALSTLGLVTDSRSGWVGLSACAGEGACGQAQFDVRAAAARRAGERGPGAPVEHWSGCARRCGLPADAAVSMPAGLR